jgi:hypothetical protein
MLIRHMSNTSCTKFYFVHFQLMTPSGLVLQSCSRGFLSCLQYLSRPACLALLPQHNSQFAVVEGSSNYLLMLSISSDCLYSCTCLPFMSSVNLIMRSIEPLVYRRHRWLGNLSARLHLCFYSSQCLSLLPPKQLDLHRISLDCRCPIPQRYGVNSSWWRLC